jgi:hypothetical protein
VAKTLRQQVAVRRELLNEIKLLLLLLLLSLAPQPSLGLGFLHRIWLNFLEASTIFFFTG